MTGRYRALIAAAVGAIAVGSLLTGCEARKPTVEEAGRKACDVHGAPVGAIQQYEDGDVLVRFNAARHPQVMVTWTDEGWIPAEPCSQDWP